MLGGAYVTPPLTFMPFLRMYERVGGITNPAQQGVMPHPNSHAELVEA